MLLSGLDSFVPILRPINVMLSNCFEVPKCLPQVAYAIGVAEPLSITVMDYGTSKKSCRELTDIVRKNFDLRPGRIVKDLKLKTPIFQQTSSYGHFGRSIFTWEQPKELQF